MPKKTAVPSAWRISAPAPLASDQRQHAEDEREAGHQDRPQAQSRGLDRGVERGHSLVLLLLLGELDDQHRVLRRQAGQHDEADLREDVVVHARAAITPAMPHRRHIGTIRMIAVESAKLSYSAEWVSQTNSTHSGKM